MSAPRRYVTKRRYAPLYKRIRTPQITVGVGPTDGIFTKLHTSGTLRWTETIGAAKSSVAIPVNWLYTLPTGTFGFNQLGNVPPATFVPASGFFTRVTQENYTGWEESLKPFSYYRISGVAIKCRFYIPFSQDAPVRYKFGILAERDFGTDDVALNTTVPLVVGAGPWWDASSSVLSDNTNWGMLNQKAYTVTTSQPGTQTYATVSCYVDAAKLLHMHKAQYKASAQNITNGTIATDTGSNWAGVTQPDTRCVAQIAFEVLGLTDGTPLTDMPNFMFDYSLTYFVHAWDPTTMKNIINERDA